MKRFAALLLSACICTVLAVALLGTAPSPSWSQLNQTATVSPGPISVECFQLCSHATGTCVSTTNTWMCVVQGTSCTTLFNCIGG
jgi:hypothetical protein